MKRNHLSSWQHLMATLTLFPFSEATANPQNSKKLFATPPGLAKQAL